MTEYYTEADAWSRSPGLQPIEFRRMPISHPDDLPEPPTSSSCSESSVTSTRKKRRPKGKRIRPSQGDVVLLNYLAPNRPDIARQAGQQTIVSGSEDETDQSDDDISEADLDNNDDKREDSEDEDGDKVMSRPAEDTQTASNHQPISPTSTGPADPLLNGSRTVSQVSQRSLNSPADLPPQLSSYSAGNEIDRRQTRSTSRRERERSDAGGSTPMHNRHATEWSMSPTQGTRRNDDIARRGPNGTDTIATSPTLQPLMIQPASRSPRQTLPAIHSESPATQDVCGSPDQQLPSVVRGLIRGIDPEYDAVSGIGRPRPPSLPSTGRTHALSPIMLTRPFPPGPQSPTRYPPPSTHATPSTMYSDQSSPDQVGILSPSASVPSPPGPELSYRSLQQPPGAFPPSLHSTSSSNTSHPSTGSSSDGFTPSSHATPNDQTNTAPETAENAYSTNPAEVRQPTASTQNGLYRCNVLGCTAAPFHTQYLLNSHANVHSEKRPHYCPVPGCQHAEGGNAKGFKRKNEMNRHQLVHKSPGFVCPFCPDREHKYPRPDNLLRHVKRHHKDRKKDDPALREVLNQARSTPGAQVVGRGRSA